MTGATIACLAAVLYLQEYKFARPVGSGPAGAAVPNQPFGSAWSHRRVQLLGIGDSVTAGLGAASKSHSYVERLIKNPGHDFPDMQGLCNVDILRFVANKTQRTSDTYDRAFVLHQVPTQNILPSASLTSLVYDWRVAPPNHLQIGTLAVSVTFEGAGWKR